MRRWVAIGDSLKILRNAGIEVQTVIDVGVQYDTKELRLAFPDVPHILFEPIAEYHEAIHENYAGLDYQLIPSAVGGEAGTLLLHDVRSDAAGVVSHVANADSEGAGTRRVPCVTLDSFTDEHPLAKPYLVKIDVDGAESAIMRGGARALWDCSCLIVETTLPALDERCYLARQCGLRLWDIVDLNFYQGNLYQLDLVFVHERQVERLPALDPYEAINRGLDPSAWYFHWTT